MLTRDNAEDYQRRHRLSYPVPYALEAEAAIGLRGKSVIEVGGSGNSAPQLQPGDWLTGIGAQRLVGAPAVTQRPGPPGLICLPALHCATETT